MPDQIMPLVGCFIAYIAFVFIFASIYHWLYKRRLYKPLPQHFFFSKDISPARKYEVENWLKVSTPQLETKIKSLEEELEVLDSIETEIKRGNHIEQLAKQSKSIALSSGKTYQITEQTVDAPVVPGMSIPGDVIEFFELVIHDKDGERLKKVVLDKPYPDREFTWYLQGCRNNLNQYRRELASNRKKLETIEDDSPDIWSYWDFFYFSVSTQTTLGYGDILPNSSTVRRLVMSQVCLGLAIIVILINFVVMRLIP